MLRLFVFSLLVSIECLPRKKSLEQCRKFSEEKSCDYFSCLDSIYQCGVENFLVQFSYPFCNALIEQTWSLLTKEGRSWATTSQICLIQELDYFLKTTSTINCAIIDRFILGKYSICLTQSHPIYSICSIMCKNLEVFFRIFDNWNLNHLNMKRFFLKISLACSEQSQMEYVLNFEQSTIRTIFWSLCLDSLKTKFINFDPNEIMIRIDTSRGLFDQMVDEEQN